MELTKALNTEQSRLKYLDVKELEELHDVEGTATFSHTYKVHRPTPNSDFNLRPKVPI